MHKVFLYAALSTTLFAHGQAGNIAHKTATQKQGHTTQQNESRRLEQTQSQDEKQPGTLGVIGDSKCGRAHTVSPGMGPTGCTRHCVDDLNAKYILITKDKIYTLNGDKKMLDNYAGESVRVIGSVGGGGITVKSIMPAYNPGSTMQPDMQEPRF